MKLKNESTLAILVPLHFITSETKLAYIFTWTFLNFLSSYDHFPCRFTLLSIDIED